MMERVHLPMKHCCDLYTLPKEASGVHNAQNTMVMINIELLFLSIICECLGPD